VSWNRLTNGIRSELVKLAVWTTEEDRRRALSYADRHLLEAQEAIAAVHAGRKAPTNLGEIVAIARYEDAGWMPNGSDSDGNFDQWRRWIPRGIETLTTGALIQWLGFVEDDMRRKLEDLENRLSGHCHEQNERLVAAQATAQQALQHLHKHHEKLILARLSVGDATGAREVARRVPAGPQRNAIDNVIREMSELYGAADKASR